MGTLTIPDPLKGEFATVQAIWELQASTRRVDALILTWVKYEKQTRRLFSFLVQQHFGLDMLAQSAINRAILANRQLYPSTFLSGIVRLARRTLRPTLSVSHMRSYPRRSVASIGTEIRSCMGSSQDRSSPRLTSKQMLAT